MTLTQPNRLYGEQSFTLLEDKLVVRVRGIGKSVEMALPYTHLSPDPTRVRQISFKFFTIAFVAFALAVMFVLMGFFKSVSQEMVEVVYVWGVLCAIFFVIFFIGGVRKSFDIIVFPTVNGRVVLRANRPTADECREFVRELQQKISDSRSIEKRVVENVLRALRAEDFLDEWKFRKALERFGVSKSEQSGPTE